MAIHIIGLPHTQISQEYKLIPLTKGLYAKVDSGDYEWLNQWKWCALKSGRTNYVNRGQWNPITKKVEGLTMHRLIMGFPSGDCQVDHINGDGLDNRRCNLRVVDRVRQSQNRPLRADNRSGYKGVYLWKSRNSSAWRAQIKVNKKRVHLGLFEDKEDAHKAYQEASRKYYGEYAREEK